MGPPLKRLNQRSENKTQMAFGISHQGKLLQQVSSNSVDPYFQHLDHFLSQGHLSKVEEANNDLVVKHENYTTLIDDDAKFEEAEIWMNKCQGSFMNCVMQAKM